MCCLSFPSGGQSAPVHFGEVESTLCASQPSGPGEGVWPRQRCSWDASDHPKDGAESMADRAGVGGTEGVRPDSEKQSLHNSKYSSAPALLAFAQVGPSPIHQEVSPLRSLPSNPGPHPPTLPHTHPRKPSRLSLPALGAPCGST